MILKKKTKTNKQKNNNRQSENDTDGGIAFSSLALGDYFHNSWRPMGSGLAGGSGQIGARETKYNQRLKGRKRNEKSGRPGSKQVAEINGSRRWGPGVGRSTHGETWAHEQAQQHKKPVRNRGSCCASSEPTRKGPS